MVKPKSPMVNEGLQPLGRPIIKDFGPQEDATKNQIFAYQNRPHQYTPFSFNLECIIIVHCRW